MSAAIQWLPVAGYEGFYEVSSLGEVRRIKASHGAVLSRPLRGGTSGGRYRTVLLVRSPGDQKGAHVARLVAAAFHGAPPSDRHQVNHKNGDTKDDRASNLEWVTPAENTRHRFDVLNKPNLHGEEHPQAVLTAAIAGEIKGARRNGASHGLIARHFGLSLAHVKAIGAGRLWAHVAPTPSNLTGRLPGRWG